MPSATMSPTAFKSLVSNLLTSISDSLLFCNAIRQNRRLGSTTAALDQLQSTLTSSQSTIKSTFRSLQKSCGSRADLGDESSRYELERSIRELDDGVKSRLSELTYEKKEGGRAVVPGFRKLDERLLNIYDDVVYTLEALSYRLTNISSTKNSTSTKERKYETSSSTYTTSSKPSTSRDVGDDFRKNCWVEKEVRGVLVYENVYDPSLRQRDIPLTGFVQYLPSSRPSSSGSGKSYRGEPTVKEVRFREQNSYASAPEYAGW